MIVQLDVALIIGDDEGSLEAESYGD
jgi:hypothetical protein